VLELVLARVTILEIESELGAALATPASADSAAKEKSRVATSLQNFVYLITEYSYG